MRQTTEKLDRYVSFSGLECEKRAEQLVLRVLETAERFEPENRFWELFRSKAQSPAGPDALFLVHSYIFYMRELLENHQDEPGMTLLEAVERDCC